MQAVSAGRNQGGRFETTDRRDLYDLSVGDIAFGNYRVSDKPMIARFSIHNYFFAKALDQVRRVASALLPSHSTMDARIGRTKVSGAAGRTAGSHPTSQ